MRAVQQALSRCGTAYEIRRQTRANEARRRAPSRDARGTCIARVFVFVLFCRQLVLRSRLLSFSLSLSLSAHARTTQAVATLVWDRYWGDTLRPSVMIMQPARPQSGRRGDGPRGGQRNERSRGPSKRVFRDQDAMLGRSERRGFAAPSAGGRGGASLASAPKASTRTLVDYGDFE